MTMCLRETSAYGQSVCPPCQLCIKPKLCLDGDLTVASLESSCAYVYELLLPGASFVLLLSRMLTQRQQIRQKLSDSYKCWKNIHALCPVQPPFPDLSAPQIDSGCPLQLEATTPHQVEPLGFEYVEVEGDESAMAEWIGAGVDKLPLRRVLCTPCIANEAAPSAPKLSTNQGSYDVCRRSARPDVRVVKMDKHEMSSSRCGSLACHPQVFYVFY